MGTDVEKLSQIINKMGIAMAREKNWKDKIIDPPHFSEVGKLGKEGFNITVSGITQPADQWDVSSEFRQRLLIELEREKIAITETVD
jgi:small conductance mechanosensitive channel